MSPTSPEAARAGNFVRARRLFREALVIVRKMKDPWGEGMTLASLGLCYTRKRFARRSIVLLEAGIDLLRRHNDPSSEARMHISAGDVYHRLHEYDGALRHFVRSYRLSLRLGNRRALERAAVRVVAVLGACGSSELFRTLCAEHGLTLEDATEIHRIVEETLSFEERRQLENGEWDDEEPPSDPWDEEEEG